MTPKDKSVTKILDQLVQQNKVMSESLECRPFQAGEIIYEAGEMANSLFLVISGRVQLYRTTPDGRRFAIATLEPGSIFGEESLLGGHGPNAYAIGMESGSVWVMPGQRAREISSTNPMFGFGLVQAMGQRVVEAENRLEQMAYSTISSRLAALLLELRVDSRDNTIEVTHQELADMLGTWRETISKTLQEFRRRGLVASARRRLTLLDMEELRLETGLL